MSLLTVGSRAHVAVQRALTFGKRLEVENASSIAIEVATAAAGTVAAVGSSVPLAAVAGGAIVLAAGLRATVSLLGTNVIGSWLRTPADAETRKRALLRSFEPFEGRRWLPPVGSPVHRLLQGFFTWGWRLPAANAPALARDVLNAGGGLLAAGVASMRGVPPSVAAAAVGGSLLLRVGMALVASSSVGQWLRAPITEVDRNEVYETSKRAYEEEFGPLPASLLRDAGAVL